MDERPPDHFTATATAPQDDSELQVLRLQENFLKLEDVPTSRLCDSPRFAKTSTSCPRPYASSTISPQSLQRLRIPVKPRHTLRLSASSQGYIYGLE
ncbi:hypothetical protein MRX96_044498 [Rhipicephalus microplus]